MRPRRDCNRPQGGTILSHDAQFPSVQAAASVMSNDWRQFDRRPESPPAVVDPQRRLRLVQAGTAALLAILFARAVQLELTQGAAFREAASQPLRRTTILPAPRGRILAADGTVLACDREVAAVAVQYRWLQDPPDARWLRQTAWASLSTSERKDPAHVAAAETLIRRERSDLARRLAGLCGATSEQWTRRERAVQERVERIAAAVGHGRSAEVAEERASHILADDAPAGAVAEIEGHPERYPGAKIIRRLRRFYPCGELAAHVLGYVVPAEDQRDGEPAGRDGVERQYDRRLRGTQRRERPTNRSRRPRLDELLRNEASRRRRLAADHPPQAPADRREAARRRLGAEGDAAGQGRAGRRRRRRDGPPRRRTAGRRLRPAIRPQHLHFPRQRCRIQTLLHAPDRPMFDRVVQMALPPGSTFKVLTAVALLEFGAVDPQETFHCQGYLRKPNEMRCEIFVRHGVGHGDVTLADALAQSCNVYFFHCATRMGPEPLADWARRLGFGHPTGVDLPGEASGIVPTPQLIARLAGRAWQATDTQMTAIGQGALTATPLQVLRLAAAMATGELIAPHVAAGPGAAQPIKGLRPATLAAIRRGMERAVADPKGTAYGAVAIESLAVAAKTGTALASQGRRDHAWLTGYAPAEAPKFAFIIVLEHAGDAAAAAGPVAKRLLLRMRQLGLL